MASENVLTVVTAKGTPSVSYNGGTTFTANSPEALNDGLQVGDAIWATGPKSGNTMAATQITYDIAPFALPTKSKKFSGIYKSHTATSVTVLKAGKARTFNVNAGTTYKENGKKVTAPKYHKGYRLIITAGEYTDSSWMATNIGVWKA